MDKTWTRTHPLGGVSVRPFVRPRLFPEGWTSRPMGRLKKEPRRVHPLQWHQPYSNQAAGFG